MKPDVCNAGTNCSKIYFMQNLVVTLVTVNIVNSTLKLVVNIIVLCKGPSGLVTKLEKNNLVIQT